MKFDVVFSNPPYNRGMDIKILNELIDISDEVIAVHPSTWLLDIKGKTALYSNFKNKINKSIVSFDMFNGNSIFDIGLFVPIVITHFDKNHTGNIDVKYFNQSFEIEDIFDITKFGKEWATLVKPFFIQMKEYCSLNKSIWDYNLTKIDESKFHCQLAAILGNCSKNENLIKDDFYSPIIKNSEANKGIRQPNLTRPGNPTPTFEFATEQERDNFISYLKTDFARFCLSLLKNNNNLAVGEMELMPWLDFTQEWDDEKLFKEFNVSQDLQKYIRDFLPDYYGIRK
jgi:hypothetical protein